MLKGDAMGKIRVAIAGVGNCASSLLQGIEFYRQCRGDSQKIHSGLMHETIGPYRPFDIEVAAAFDIDKRKVGKAVSAAIFSPPNNTREICRDFAQPGPVVQMGPILDGYSGHMSDYPEEQRFAPSAQEPVDVERVLRERKVDILVNYLPVGSQQATEYYAQAALANGISLVNCIPVFIVSHTGWADRFRAKNIPCIGDDIKAQIGATIVHRVLTKLFRDRGAKLEATYQLNTGGNTDFLNMLNRERLISKRISKTEAVQSQLAEPLDADQIHIGPSDYVAWQKDNKVCFLRMEGRGFAGVPLNLELRLSVEDSPNSGGVAIDAIRFCQLAHDLGLSGPLLPMSAYFMKHPPRQMTDEQARGEIEEFLSSAEAVDTGSLQTRLNFKNP